MATAPVDPHQEFLVWDGNQRHVARHPQPDLWVKGRFESDEIVEVYPLRWRKLPKPPALENL